MRRKGLRAAQLSGRRVGNREEGKRQIGTSAGAYRFMNPIAAGGGDIHRPVGAALLSMQKRSGGVLRGRIHAQQVLVTAHCRFESLLGQQDFAA